MIVQDIHLYKYDWDIRVYYALDTYYIDDILDDLMVIGCLPKELFAVEELFTSGELNRGYTFTNSRLKTSIVIIGKTSSADEFQNTILEVFLYLVIIRHIIALITTIPQIGWAISGYSSLFALAWNFVMHITMIVALTVNYLREALAKVLSWR